MGCNCGGATGRRQIVYVLTVPGGQPQTFLTQADAAAAKTRQGGRGSIARTSRDPR